jgi:hypothetical protein
VKEDQGSDFSVWMHVLVGKVIRRERKFGCLQPTASHACDALTPCCSYHAAQAGLLQPTEGHVSCF